MKLSGLFAFVLAGAALSACSSSVDGPDEPDICPDPLLPESIIINSQGHYTGWTNMEGVVEISATSTLVQPSGARITGYTLCVGEDYVSRHVWPLDGPIRLKASDFGHGRHDMELIAEVEDADGQTAAKPVFEGMKFIVFNRIPEVELAATMSVEVNSVSTSGERHHAVVEVESGADGRLRIPADRLNWQPEAGTASHMDVSLIISPAIGRLSDGLEARYENLQWNMPGGGAIEGSKVNLRWSNPVRPDDWHGLTPSCLVKYQGRYEGIELADSTLDGFVLLVE